MTFDIIGHVFDVRTQNYFDATFPQVVAIRRDVGEIVGNEANPVSQMRENREDLKHAKRTGVPVRHGQMMVDNKNTFIPLRELFQRSNVAVGRFGGESFLPLRCERLSVNFLMLLRASRYVSSTGRSFEMEHLAERLIKHFESGRSYLESQICVFVVGGNITTIKPADPLEKRFREHKAGGGTIIYLTQEIVFWFARIIEFPAIPTRTIPPDNPAGFL